MSGVAFYQVNAFCGPGAAGNPAAVCILDAERPTEWMQEVAAQLNLSETGFVRQGSATPAIRWFSPITEMPLCGHVTLAAAHVLFSLGYSGEDELTFSSAGGPLSARYDGERIELDFPAIDCQPISAPGWLSDVLGITITSVLASSTKYLIELTSEQQLLDLKPDFAAIRKQADRGIIVTTLSSLREFDVVSRYFAGYVGVDEDPATGSAHCCLAPYWSRKLGRRELRMLQASPRGGIFTTVDEGPRVRLGGQAQTIISGTLHL